MKIITTWTGDGEFTAKHVQALQRQCAKYAPLDDFYCITPKKIPGVECLPDTHCWPGWWVKFEAFAPHITGTILYMDIDTVIVGPLDDLVKQTKLTMLRDFYRDGKKLKMGLQASLMLLPEEDRFEPWSRFRVNPTKFMEENKAKGDQPMLEECYMGRAQIWQDVLPGQIVSAKVDCGAGNIFRPAVVPADARIIIFHGRPRPWDCKEFEELYQ